MHASNLLSRRAFLTPNRIAVNELHTKKDYSYEQLNNRSNRCANFMKNVLNVSKGDRVSILANNCIAYIDLFYGLCKIGAVFSPLNWRLTANELKYIISDCTPKVLIIGPEFKDLYNEMKEDIDVKHIISLEEAGIANTLSYEDELSESSDLEPVYPEMTKDDPFCILYTSGTTGHPKGAIIPHRQILWNCINTVASWGLTENDISPVYTPLFHAGGLFAFLTPLLYIGGRILLSRVFDSEETLKNIVEKKCTVVLGVPTLYKMWRDSDYFINADFSHVNFFISGGAPCPQELIEEWRSLKNVVFRQGYGLTEVGPNCFTMTNNESFNKPGSVGKPIFHSEMKLVDPETNLETEVNVPGELLIKGPTVCVGYWNNTDATSSSICDNWFHTGDMVHKDEDGFYYIDGRYKDMIKSGGENIYAAEVESVFLEHPAVKGAALIGIPDDKWGEIGLMAVVLDKDDTDVEKTDLIKYCHGKLAKYKIPKKIVFMDDLPYTAYGKVKKNVLKEQIKY